MLLGVTSKVNHSASELSSGDPSQRQTQSPTVAKAAFYSSDKKVTYHTQSTGAGIGMHFYLLVVQRKPTERMTESVAFLMCQVQPSLSLVFHKSSSCTRAIEENCLELEGCSWGHCSSSSSPIYFSVEEMWWERLEWHISASPKTCLHSWERRRQAFKCFPPLEEGKKVEQQDFPNSNIGHRGFG